MGLAHNDPCKVTHVTSPEVGVKGHLGVIDLWLKYSKKGSLYPHALMNFYGAGHNNPWVELHM